MLARSSAGFSFKTTPNSLQKGASYLSFGILNPMLLKNRFLARILLGWPLQTFMGSRNIRDARSLDEYVWLQHFLKVRNGAEAWIIRRIHMIMKDLQIQAKKTSRTRLLLFSAGAKLDRKAYVCSKNQLLIRISEILTEQKSNEKPILEQNRAWRDQISNKKLLFGANLRSFWGSSRQNIELKSSHF